MRHSSCGRVTCLGRLVGLITLVTCCVTAHGADLFRDDFSRFPAGWLTRPLGQLNGAIQEYHYLADRGVALGPVGQRDLPPGRLGRRRRGRARLPRAAHGQRSGAADEPAIHHRRP